MRTATRIHLAFIPSVEKVLRGLGTFASVNLHIFSAIGIHSSSVTELLCLIEILEDHHTKVKGVISSPQLAISLIYDVSWRWIQYLNRCVNVSALGVLESPGSIFLFYLKLILVRMDRGS